MAARVSGFFRKFFKSRCLVRSSGLYLTLLTLAVALSVSPKVIAQPGQKQKGPQSPTQKKAQKDEDKVHQKSQDEMDKQTKEFQRRKRYGSIPKSKA